MSNTRHEYRRRHAACPAAVLLAAVMLAGCGAESSFPSRPIEIVCPWSAGGGTDRIARQLAMQLERRLGVPVNVVNATGGSGVVGFARGAGARPDGHTLMIMTVELSMLHRRGLTALTAADFAPLALLNQDAAALFVPADSPYGTLADLEAAIRGQPGRLKCGGSAQGAIWHAAVVGWLDARGLPGDAVTWVSINGASPALQELTAGGLDFVCCSVPEADALAAAGRVRCLGAMSATRLAAFPDVPTFREQGVDWVLVGWRGVGAPSQTPPDRLAVLADALEAEAQGEEFQAFLATAGFDHSYLPPAAFAEKLADDDALYERLLSLEAFRSVAADAFGPFVFPTLAALGLAVAGGIAWLPGGLARLRGRAAAGPRGAAESTRPRVSRRGLVRAGAVVAAVVAFIGIVGPLGFTLAAAGLLGGLLCLLGVRLLPAVGIATTAAVACFGIFGILLRVPLPRGPFGW